MAMRIGLAGAAVAVSLFAAPAFAQTAQQYQQATAALQLCGSAAGALIAECAAVRGAFVNNPMGVVGALNASGANGLANAFGLNNAAANMLANSGLSAAQAAQMNAGASTATAMGIVNAGQAYQQCVLANQANWQSCLSLMNGGQPVNLPAPQAAPALTAAQTAAIQQATASATAAAQAAAAAAIRALDPLATQALATSATQAAQAAQQALQSAPAAPRPAPAPAAASNPMSVLGF